jgi:large subunit ribosomal protein L17
MRHRKKKVTLDRKRSARQSLLRNMAESLFIHGRIKTTMAKARVLRPLAEQLITKAKKPDLAARRELIRQISPRVTNKLFKEIAPNQSGRQGGYIRITKLSRRRGDNASMALIEII